MRVVHHRSEIREWSAGMRLAGQRIGLVPTMGALHAGHTSLVGIAKGSGVDRVVMSIFVNPLQFGPGEDFDRYPRDRERDLDLARAAGVDVVFVPGHGEMYPAGEPVVRVVPGALADRLCGRARPGHFAGVLTVVAKLFGISLPDVAVFGQKDYQQLVLIRRMVADLEFPVEVLSGPIVREDDGLAMSSRNRYLSPVDRQRARSLSRALRECEVMFEKGVHEPVDYLGRLHEAEGEGVSVEYAEVIDPHSLEPAGRVGEGTVCAIAARVGGTRLIDNHILGTRLAF